MFAQFLSLLTKKEKKATVFIIILLLFLAGSELISLGLILPFVGLIVNPELVNEGEKLNVVYKLLGADSVREFQFQIGFILITVFVLKTVFACYIDKKRIRFVKMVEHNLMSRLLRANLSNKYPFFIKHPPSALYHNLVGETPQVSIFLDKMLIIFSESAIILAVVALFLLVSAKATLLLFGAVVFVLVANFGIIRKRVNRCSKQREIFGLKRGRSSLQYLNGIKDLKIFNNESFFLKKFKEYNAKFLESEVTLNFIQRLQFRILVLTAFVSIILVLLLLVYTNLTTKQIIPVISIFATGTFRLLPSAAQVLASATVMKHSSRFIKLVHNLLSEAESPRQEVMQELQQDDIFVDKEQRLSFKQSIKVAIHSFTYESRDAKLFEDFFIEFPVNQTVGLVGGSGSGKTTLIDILLGLHVLEDGEIRLDGSIVNANELFKLRNNIGYVPQKVFLYDTSILNNIAFGYEGKEIDINRIAEVIEIAQLRDFIEELPQGLDAVVGEFGVKLSGGQVQRIGIARALYRDPEVIILDEATSSLDNKTEAELMDCVNRLKGQKTIIISAHRLTTIQDCDIVHFLENGKIKDSGTFQELLEKSKDFSRLVLLQA